MKTLFKGDGGSGLLLLTPVLIVVMAISAHISAHGLADDQELKVKPKATEVNQNTVVQLIDVELSSMMKDAEKTCNKIAYKRDRDIESCSISYQTVLRGEMVKPHLLNKVAASIFERSEKLSLVSAKQRSEGKVTVRYMKFND